MCKLQSVLLVYAFVCTLMHLSPASPSGRVGVVNSNGKSPSSPLPLESRPAVHKAATKAQERQHHLGLMTDATEDDFTENPGKEDEIGYLRSFNEQGAGGYDHYEAFHNQDGDKYDDENEKHTETEKSKKGTSYKDKSDFEAEEKKDDDERTSYEEKEDLVVENNFETIEPHEKDIKEKAESVEEQSGENIKPNGEKHVKKNHPKQRTQMKKQKKSYFQWSCKNCSPRNIKISGKIMERASRFNDSKPTGAKPKTYTNNLEKRNIESSKRKRLNPSNYEVHEYPDEGSRNIFAERPHNNHHHPKFTYPKEDSRFHHNVKQTNARPWDGSDGRGGSYEAYIVHDKKVDGHRDYKRPELEDRENPTKINYYYSTPEDANLDGKSGVRKNQEPTNYDNRNIKIPHDDDNKDDEDDSKRNLGEKDNLDGNIPIFDDYNGDKDDIGIDTQAGKDDYSSDETIDYYDDRTGYQQRNSNYEENTNDPNDNDYDYNNDKGNGDEPATFKEVKESVSGEYDNEYYYGKYKDDDDDDDAEDSHGKGKLSYSLKPKNSKDTREENVYYDYVSEGDSGAEDEDD